MAAHASPAPASSRRGAQCPTSKPFLAAQRRRLHEATLRAALETLLALRQSEEALPPLPAAQRQARQRFLDGVAQLYLVYLTALVEMGASAEGSAPNPTDPALKEATP